MATNPFHYGALALDDAFTDREAEVAELTADLRNGQDVVVFAPRRYGKTSLVWKVTQGAGARGVLVAHCDLMTTPTKERLAEKLAKTIHEDIASPLERARDKALAVFRGLRVQPQITLDSYDGSVSFGFGVDYASADVDATLERLLELPGELGADRGRRVALVLDEFQEVTDIDPELPKLMRSVFQTQPEVAHVYLGSKRHLMRRIFNDENEPFWRSAKQLELGLIPTDDFARFVRERFESTGRRIELDALGRLLALTGGHPYATQQLAYFLWEEIGERGTASLDHLDRALGRLLRSEHAHFSLVWEDASRDQKLLLLSLAAEPGRPFTADYRRRHRLPAPTNVQRALGALTKRELVAKDGEGRQRIVEPFLAEWVVDNQL